MRTIALRFSNNFAPECGTIKAHQELIDQFGYVWYGKLGAKVSATVAADILKNETPKILLIHSGTYSRYWAFVKTIQYETPILYEIPEYYRNNTDPFKTWFKVEKIEKAPKDVLSHCLVASSGTVLTKVSMHSMNPYFIIDYSED